MIAISDILVQFRIRRHGHPVGGGDQIVPRIIIERGAVSEDERLSLNTVNGGELFARKRKIRGPPLQTHLTKSLTHGNLGDFVRVDPESPVHPGFTSGVIRLI